MKKMVAENLNDFVSMNEEKKTLGQSGEDKAKQAIKGLKKELETTKKSSKFPTKMQKDAKIKELEDKISKWEKKLKK